MPDVALKPLPNPPTPDGYVYYNMVVYGPGDAPPKPEQQPPLGIWGPTDPRPTHPISGIPGLPGYEPPPGGPGPGPGPGGGQAATLRPVPEGATVPPVDEGWIDAVITPAGGQPSWAKIGPYLEHHPA